MSYRIWIREEVNQPGNGVGRANSSKKQGSLSPNHRFGIEDRAPEQPRVRLPRVLRRENPGQGFDRKVRSLCPGRQHRKEGREQETRGEPDRQ